MVMRDKTSTTAAATVMPLAMRHSDSRTEFKGWGTAHFPRGTDLLQKMLNESFVTRDWLDQAALQVEGFPLRGVEDEPQTSDGVTDVLWEVGYYFNLPRGGEAVVLVPKKGSKLFCAVYSRGDGSNDMDTL